MFSLWYGVFFLIHDTLNWCHANQWNIGCQLLFSIISTIFSISDCSSNLLCFSKCSLEVNKGNNFHFFGPTMCSSVHLHAWDGYWSKFVASHSVVNCCSLKLSFFWSEWHIYSYPLPLCHYLLLWHLYWTCLL